MFQCFVYIDLAYYQVTQIRSCGALSENQTLYTKNCRQSSLLVIIIFSAIFLTSFFTTFYFNATTANSIDQKIEKHPSSIFEQTTLILANIVLFRVMLIISRRM